MSRDHIIPQFILRGFALNPTVRKENQKIMVYDKEIDTTSTELIADAFAIKDFNPKETEQFLAQEYETDVARVFRDIKKCVDDGKMDINIAESDYKLLIRFFVVMWRRNDVHMKKLREMSSQLEKAFKNIFGSEYEKMKKLEYKDYTFESMFEEHKDEIRNRFYSHAIQNTTDDDPTVKKTLSSYSFVIAHNKSTINFIMHNLYATLLYDVSKNDPVITSYDNPGMMIYPISKTLCIYGLRGNATSKKDNNFVVPIEIWSNDDDVKKCFIDMYMINNAKYYVVDETNIEFVKNKR